MQKIKLKNITHHNLKNINIEIPHNKLTVITGVSGSGKSTLAIDVIYRAAEKLFLETYSIHARQFFTKMRRPEVEYISGLRPAIHLEQKNYINSPRATVGTLTALHDLLRLLFARLGKSSDASLRINRSLFSFNKPEGACPVCNGLALVEHINPDLLISDENKSLRQGALVITTSSGYTVYSQVTIDVMDQVCNSEGFSVDIPWKELTDYQKNVVLYGSNKIKILFGKHSLESRMKWKGITAKPREEGYYKGIVPVMEEILKRDRNKNILRFVSSKTCEACGGSRFNKQAFSVQFKGKNIAELLALNIAELHDYFKNIKFDKTEKEAGTAIQSNILEQTQILSDLGLSYLPLDRPAASLSGSEAARIRLSTQISSKLRGILYVFDEPAAGLHASDMNNLLQKIIELRNNGNTVIIVEHNEQIIRKADYLIELGPGAGNFGGKLLYHGNIPDWEQIYKNIPESKTAGYLSRKIKITKEKNPVKEKFIKIYGAKARNLKNIDVAFPLNTLTVISGVSGAGKSSLIKYTLANYLRNKLHRARVEYGNFSKIEGIEQIDKIIEINQSPIGKTSRSNPATYTKLFDEIRNFYAKLPEAQKQKFTKSYFSFNAKGGRCEHCQGAGYIQTGMHFLENIEIVCPVCNGKRFKKELLAVKYKNKNIYDILNLSINEACTFFADLPKIKHFLTVLKDLGLGYLKLGQPSSSLSGGEAQRIKLAAELSRPSTGKTLYILDEPTRGLHLHDISVLFKSLQKLIDKGNTILVIEHNLHFINQADFIIDLGPGSGKMGGNVLFSGSPDAIIHSKKSLTGRFLNKLRNDASKYYPEKENQNLNLPISFKGITTHNLKNINIEIPANQLVVFTGVSGSGKSSLLYNTVYAESRRLFNESFSPYVRTQLGSMKKAGFDEASGLTPVIALEQKRLKANAHSTVGTLTEIYDYYRLLYSRIGRLRYPDKADKLTAAHFSFNQSQGWCELCGGLGFKYVPDWDKVVSDKEKSLLNGALDGSKTGKFYGEPNGQYIAILKAVGEIKNIDFSKSWQDLSIKEKEIAFYGCGDEEFDVKWYFKRGKREGIQEFKSKWKGFSGYILDEYKRKEADKRAEALLPLMKKVSCQLCEGKRLNKTALSVKIKDLDIAELSDLPVDKSIVFFQNGKSDMPLEEQKIFELLAAEIIRRLKKIEAVGLSYLKMNRLSMTLSGGEAKRIRLAAMLGSGLSGITYILDEPSAGLHPSDNAKLIAILKELRDLGNTVLVAEHNAALIKSADYLFELGFGAGEKGGTIIAQGNLKDILASQVSVTAKYLNRKEIPLLRKLKQTKQIALSVKNVAKNNLKNINVDFYEGVINVLHGKSGSGKSSLLEFIDEKIKSDDKSAGKIIFVDQSLPQGRANTSVATYSTLFDDIAAMFAKKAKVKKSYFSLNTKGGRCEECKGNGFITLPMDFLSDVETVCEKCGGKRYQSKVLENTIAGKSIADVLETTIEDLSELPEFDKNTSMIKKIELLKKTGLGYLKTGQTLKKLSGGELQRIKLAKDLIKAGKNRAIYLFDEPTNGLHFKDIEHLIILFEELINQGNTLIISEHHPYIKKNADYLIELGPEGGEKGGKVMSTKWNN
ncbi:MAG: excinuclease ABC subunit UvrA [Bacteroidales bacterium]|nr:excinuclease ABC subunit UvrA [Bacteroidales bacterium]